MSSRELWDERRGTILVALLAVVAAALGFYLVTKEDSSSGSAPPTAVSATSPVGAEQESTEPAGDGHSHRDQGDRGGGGGGEGSGGGREDFATAGQSSGGPAPQAVQPLETQPGGEGEPTETVAEDQPPASANGAADSSESTEPVGSGGQPPSENPDLHGPPTQLAPDEPDRPGDKPQPDRGDPRADGSDEPPGK